MRQGSPFPLAATLAVQLLVSMAVVTVPVLAPALGAGTGLAPRFAGFFIALVYGASMGASVVAGALVRRFGAIRLSQLCLAACAAGLACLATGAWPLIVASAVLLGAGYGPVTPASSHVLAKSTPPRMMAFVFSLKQTGVPLGGVLAGAVVPGLVALAGWRAACLAVAAACLATAALAQPLRAWLDADRDPSSPLSAHGLASPVLYTLGNPALRRLAFSSFFFASLQLCLVTFLVTHLTLDLGYSLVQAGLMLSAAQAGGVVARVAWGMAADRWGRPMRLLGLLAIAMGLGAAATAAFTAQWPAAAVAAVCAAFGATAIGWNGVYLAQVARLAPPGKAGDATGGSLVFTYGGVLFGPPAFTFLVGAGAGYGAAWLALAAPAVACGLWLLARERRPGDDGGTGG